MTSKGRKETRREESEPGLRMHSGGQSTIDPSRPSEMTSQQLVRILFLLAAVSVSLAATGITPGAAGHGPGSREALARIHGV